MIADSGNRPHTSGVVHQSRNRLSAGNHEWSMSIMEPDMQMLQEMQREMQRIQDQLGETLVTGTAGNGLVTVRMTALKEMRGVTIKPEAIDASDATLLEDLVVAAVNDALAKADATAQSQLGGLMGGLGLPGMA